ncbi:MAG TPA: glycosyl hydrolase family 28 protein [Blastocatellia bacterium]|nr:glycosyl hydrolase family 28 protein [Blastocatellia bacterium]
MNDSRDTALSRREWLGQMSAPAVAATLGRGLPGATGAAADDKALGARTYNVRDFGAKGDGTTLDTAAVQAAIDACNRDKGGVVLVPAGDFLVGTIELRSNVTLHLAALGRLLGSGSIEHYKAGNGVPPGNGNVVMISAANAENVTIEGPGTIDGNGAKFFTGKGDNTGPGQNSAQGYSQRPHLLIFYRCHNLRIRDIFLTASAYHCARILQCRRVYLDGVRIHNRVNLNNDGFHINSSEYVHIVNCDVACQDDACALFGSNKWVTVTNCTFSTRWSVFRFGGGEAENITISNCVIYDTYGCPVKMRCGARSRFENITFSNLIMKNVTGPISIGLDSSRGGAAGAAQPVKGVIRNIAFNGIRAAVVAEGRQHEDLPWPQKFRPGETRCCIVVNGVRDEFIEGISFQDVHVVYEGGGTAEEAAREVPHIAGEYFEIGTPPAYGLYARNVRGLTLQNIRLEVSRPDLRPAVIFDHVADAALNGLSAQGNPQAGALLRFIEARSVLLTASRLLSPAAVFLQLEGATSEGITIDGGDLSKAGRPVAFSRGATAKTVKLRA